MQPLTALPSSISMICNEFSIPLLPMPNMNKIKPPISDKSTVRAEVKRRVSLLSEEEKNEGSKNICLQLI
jgi:hypothetical protein